MQSNYTQYSGPHFRILSDNQIEELHLATLQILEKTGISFQCQEALDILSDAGADVSNPSRVKIPSYIVKQALKTAPKTVTLYSRQGEPAIVLDGQSGSHFGGVPDCPEYLDPYTGNRRKCYVEDIADMARLFDALPNLEFMSTSSAHNTLPGVLPEKISVLQVLINSSKPFICNNSNVSSLKETLDLCSLVAGGEKQLRKKPFFGILSEPVSPLIQGKDALEKSLLCIEKGIPVIVQSMPMAGATTPATWPGCLAVTSAETLSQLVVLQLKKPGTPVIFGGVPSVMDMKTMIFAQGAPELGLLVAALTELSHFYKLPMYGTAGFTDAAVVGAQVAAEAMYEIVISALSGQDLVHNIAVGGCLKMISPEMAVLGNELVDMVKILMRGVEINDETLPLTLIDRLGPGSNYVAESHTLKHFRKFWVPTIFDRSFIKTEDTKHCEQLLKEKTIEILKTHHPKPVSDEVLKEVKKVEANWLEREGLKEYPKKP